MYCNEKVYDLIKRKAGNSESIDIEENQITESIDTENKGTLKV